MPEISNKQQNFERILTNHFSIDEFVDIFVPEFLNGVVVYNNAKNKRSVNSLNYQDFIKYVYSVGSYETPQRAKMGILAVCLASSNNVERARSKQRNYVKQILKNNNMDAALVAFFTENDDKWRLSFVRLDSIFANGKFKDELTPKRYSYLVGKGEPCHTAQEYLFSIYDNENDKPSLEDIEKVFSVEKVTDEFFALYQEKFLELQEILKNQQSFVAEAERCNFTSEQFAKKLMGQIVFLYFIQKKGWLGVDAFPETISKKDYNKALYAPGYGGRQRDILVKVYQDEKDRYRLNGSVVKNMSEEDVKILAAVVKSAPWGTGPKNFVRVIFDSCLRQKRKFLKEYLEPFFYTGLNIDRGVKGYYHPFHRCVPFLNGGLFEKIAKEYDWENTDFDVPNEFFSNIHIKGRDADGLLDIFDRYNFTMDEEEPMEREVAIDPEMLGKVFENLLEIKDRKSKGAFYTPREIVHYMCQESLINYLTGKMKIPEQDIRDFILYGDLMKDEDTSYDGLNGSNEMLISPLIYDRKGSVNRLAELDKYLAEVKICDPAVGSGAFPMGLINEIVRARDVLTYYMAVDVDSNKGHLLLNVERTHYYLKTQTIKNCIFACDIMPSAVDIAKLRLWLSIVIDDEISTREDELEEKHTKPRQLPNLDCNIICGNSLLDEFMGVKLVNGETLFAKRKLGQKELFSINRQEQIGLFEAGLDGRITDLMELQDSLFFEKDSGKKQEIKTEIQSLYNDIIMEQLGENPSAVEAYYEQMQKVSRPFVLWPLFFPKVFAQNGGFDIVIGNPPYVSTKGRTAKEKADLMNCFGFADDLYSHFYFKALDICRENGVVTFITPDTFFTTITKNNLRKLILDNTLLELIHLGHDVFASAMVSTAICLIGKNKAEDNMVRVLDAKGCKKLKDAKHYACKQNEYRNSINKAFFVPNEFNNKLNEIFAKQHTELVNLYWEKIVTSAEIRRNAIMLKDYRDSLKPGDITLIGLVTEGGQGLATANNGRYVGYREGTKGAERAAIARVQKLNEFNREHHCDYKLPQDEQEVWKLFEGLKTQYGRDIFGQGFIYKIVPDNLIADVSNISADEKLNGLNGAATFVPYDKGDKEGNRWYLETPFVIDWGKKSVEALKESCQRGGVGSARFQNTQFYFREGFCWNNNLNENYVDIKCKLKGKSVPDVASMSLYSMTVKIPNFWLVLSINNKIAGYVYRKFLNATVNVQINDIRLLPIVVPTKKQVEDSTKLFEQAVNVQKNYFEGVIDNTEKEIRLRIIQEGVELWACELYGISPELLRGQENYVR